MGPNSMEWAGKTIDDPRIQMRDVILTIAVTSETAEWLRGIAVERGLTVEQAAFFALIYAQKAGLKS